MRRVLNSSVVLLPIFNDRDKFSRTINNLSSLPHIDILVLDHLPQEGMGWFAEELTKYFPCLFVLHLNRMKIERAFAYGFHKALIRNYSKIVTLDRSSSYSLEDIAWILNGLEEAEVIVGSRHISGEAIKGWSKFNRLLSRLLCLYLQKTQHLPIIDITSIFRGYCSWAVAAADINSIKSNGIFFHIAILKKIIQIPGFKISEIFICRSNGKDGDWDRQ